MTWTDTWFRLLLMFLARSKELYELVEAKIDPVRLYRRDLLPLPAIILKAMTLCKEQFGSLPTSAEVLKALLDDAMESLGCSGDALDIERLHNWAEAMYSPSEELAIASNQTLGRKLTMQFVLDFDIRPKLDDLAHATSDGAALREQLISVSSQLTDILAEEPPQEFYPLLQPEKYLHPLKADEVGLQFWDKLFPGGLRHSETYVILGPTGNGKSLLAIQLGVKVALSRKVYFATFEQRAFLPSDPRSKDSPLHSEFTIRALGPAAGLSRSDLTVPYDQLSYEHQQRIKQIGKTQAYNFQIRDYTGAGRTRATISSLFEDVRKEHARAPIDLLIIDPFWPMVQNTCEVLGTPVDSAAMRTQAAHMAGQINRLCKELNITIVLVHQLGASAAEKGIQQLTAYGAGEIRTLVRPLENALAISKVGPTGHCGLVCVKSRSSGRQGKIVDVRLDGNANMFVEQDKDKVGGTLFLQDDQANISMRDARKVIDYVFEDKEEKQAKDDTAGKEEGHDAE